MLHLHRQLGVTVVIAYLAHTPASLANLMPLPRPQVVSQSTPPAENSPKEFELKDFSFWAEQCRSLATEKLYSEALIACEQAISLNSEKDKRRQQQQTIELWKLRSNALFQLGRYRDAIGSYNYVLGVEPNYSLGLTYRCEALAKLGRYESAISACDQALRVDGDWGDRNPAAAWYARGTTLRTMQQLPEAITAYDQALAIQPKDPVIEAERCDAVFALLKVQEEKLAKEPTEALKTDKEQTETESKTCLRALETMGQDQSDDTSPPPPLAWYKQGLVFDRLGRFPEARAAFEQVVIAYEQALAATPNDPSGWMVQGIVLKKLDQDARALSSFEKVLQLRPNSSLALVHQCTILNRLKRFQDALASCDGALKGDGLWEELRPADAWSQRSRALLGLKQYEEAVAAADRSIALDPTNAETYNSKAIGLWYLKDYLSAEAAVKKAIDLDPQYPQGLLTLGRILSTQGKYRQAVTLYTEALMFYDQTVNREFRPSDPVFRAEILTNKAVALWKTSRVLEALETIRTAIALNPQSFEAHLNHGIIAIDADELEEALKAFAGAEQLLPNNVYAITGRGITLKRLRRYSEAVSSLKLALTINPNYIPAQKAYEAANRLMKEQWRQQLRQQVTEPQR